MYTAVLPVCEPRASAWRLYDAEAVTRISQSRTTEEAGQNRCSTTPRPATRWRASASASLPALSNTPVEKIDARELALHDAQSVIAREHGFPSWNALREEVEARTLTFAEAVDEFVRAATGGAADRARRLLKLHPAVATATLQTALVLGDAAQVEARLTERPGLATTPGGPQQWEPLLYVCHTCLHRDDPERMDGLLTIARRLIALGANPNAEYHWNWHPGVAAHGAVGRADHHGPCAARAGAPRGRRESHRRRVGAHRRRQRQPHRARIAAPFRHGRERHPRRRAAAGLHPDLRGGSVRSAMAAGPWRRRQSAMGSRPRSTPPRRRETLGCGDGGVVAETWRRSRTPARRWLHAALAGGAPRQSRHRGLAPRARRDERIVAARSVHRRRRPRRSRRRR